MCGRIASIEVISASVGMFEYEIEPLSAMKLSFCALQAWFRWNVELTAINLVIVLVSAHCASVGLLSPLGCPLRGKPVW